MRVVAATGIVAAAIRPRAASAAPVVLVTAPGAIAIGSENARPRTDGQPDVVQLKS